jgi:hypothetical protein
VDSRCQDAMRKLLYITVVPRLVRGIQRLFEVT